MGGRGYHVGWWEMWATGWGVRAGGLKVILGARLEGQGPGSQQPDTGRCAEALEGGISGHTANIMEGHRVLWGNVVVVGIL